MPFFCFGGSLKAIILAAGYGTRLYPLTRNTPKPLLAVGKKPIIEWIIDRLSAVDGIDRIFVVTNHRFASNFAEWQRKFVQKSATPVEIIDDNTGSNEDRLGAIGDMNFCIDKAGINDDLLVVAGDNLFEFDVNEFVKFAAKKPAAIALKDMKGSEPSAISRYSIVELDPKSRITDFQEKPQNPKTSLISIGIYLYRKNVLKKIKEYIAEGNTPDAPGYFVQWLHKRTEVYGYVTSGLWYDIGDIDSYTKACAIYEGK